MAAFSEHTAYNKLLLRKATSPLLVDPRLSGLEINDCAVFKCTYTSLLTPRSSCGVCTSLIPAGPFMFHFHISGTSQTFRWQVPSPHATSLSSPCYHTIIIPPQRSLPSLPISCVSVIASSQLQRLMTGQVMSAPFECPGCPPGLP